MALKFNSVIWKKKWYRHRKNKVKSKATVVCKHLSWDWINYFVYMEINNIHIISDLQTQHSDLERGF